MIMSNSDSEYNVVVDLFKTVETLNVLAKPFVIRLCLDKRFSNRLSVSLYILVSSYFNQKYISKNNCTYTNNVDYL